MIKAEELEKEIPLSETSKYRDPACAEYLDRDGYYFCQLGGEARIFDAIIIINHDLELSLSPRYPKSTHSLEEHIRLINELGIKKACIIGVDIEFIRQCPSLKHLSIYPSHLAANGFDYSPLYDLPEISSLVCQTRYGKNEEYTTKIDYSGIKGLKSLAVSQKGHLNFHKLDTLEKLALSGHRGKSRDLTDAFCSRQLKELSLIQCGIRSLNGLTQSECISSVSLAYCRSLEDVSELSEFASTLTELHIINCPQITDFGFLHALVNLEHLHLEGKNKIPDLSFIPLMPKLRRFGLWMTVEDGDLTNCLSVPYAYCDNHKHYNLKDSQLPKNLPEEGRT